jgi:hypothetical protein
MCTTVLEIKYHVYHLVIYFSDIPSVADWVGSHSFITGNNFSSFGCCSRLFIVLEGAHNGRHYIGHKEEGAEEGNKFSFRFCFFTI